MIALARKYRPKRFADLLVQDHVAAALRGAVAQGRPAHGYLFAGPRGVGKTTAARILAMALNCAQRTAASGEPCGACDSCTRVWTGAANLDVVEMDAASNRGVDDARDLRERAMYAASAEGRSKVYIVDEAHMLTREAWNALLKILEEPPPRVVFVFATTEPQKIAQSAAPVLSRLQRFDFRRIGPDAIVTRLREVVQAEGIEAETDALQLIARCADGGMRDALSVLDQVVAFGDGPVTAQRVRDVLGLIPDDVYADALRLVADRDAAAVFPLMDRLVEAGADLGEFVVGLGDTLRAVLLVGLGGEPHALTEGLRRVVHEHADTLPPPDAVRLLAVLAEVEPQVRHSGHPRLAVELLLLRWALMDRTVDLAQVLAALESGPDRPPSPPSGGRKATGSGTAPGGTGGAEPRPPGRGIAGGSNAAAAVLNDVAPRAGTADAAPPAAERGPLELERLRALWPRIVAAARSAGPLLVPLLAAAEVEGVEGNTVVLRATATVPGHAAGLTHKRAAIATAIGTWVEGPIAVRVREAEPAAGDPRPGRMTRQSAEAERLKALQAKDAALSAAVEALDLELLE